MNPVPTPSPFRSLAVTAASLALCLATASAQGSVSGPYTANSFETHTLGTLPGYGYADGQDGWLLLDDRAPQANLGAVKVQTAQVRSGKQAVKWDAAAMTPHCFGELRRNAMFNLTNGVIECEMDFFITSSANPSGMWEYYTQPAPIPTTCQMRWGVARDGRVSFYSTSSRVVVQTGYVVTRDAWHHARTVVDIAGDRTEIHIDGTLVGTGQPIGTLANLPTHGFSQLNVVDAGDDAFCLDNFTVRERIAPHSLSLDLARLPIGTRSLVEVRLTGGAALANRAYVLAASLSGTSPGIPLGTVVLPLVPDAFLVTLVGSLGGTAYPGFLGTFNASGNATARFDTYVPVPPALLGANLDFAYVTLSPFDAVSEPVRARITP